MSAYIAKKEFSTFFLLACGAVIKEGTPLSSLKEVSARYVFSALIYPSLTDFHRLKFTDVFAFGAERLIARQVAIWIIMYTDQVVVGGQPSADSIGNLLYSTSAGKYTSIVYLKKTTSGVLDVSKFIWDHKFQRPHGSSYPLACHLCRCIYSWDTIAGRAPTDGSAYNLVCKTTGCKGTWEVPARPSSSKVVASPYVGTWRKV